MRFYTEKGLVPSVLRDQNNIRRFDEELINWLHGVKRLKQSGMPLEAIKLYVNLCQEGDSSIQQRCSLMMEHKEVLGEAKQHVAHLGEKITLYRAILDQSSPDTTNPVNWGKIKHYDVFYR